MQLRAYGASPEGPRHLGLGSRGRRDEPFGHARHLQLNRGDDRSDLLVENARYARAAIWSSKHSRGVRGTSRRRTGGGRTESNCRSCRSSAFPAERRRFPTPCAVPCAPPSSLDCLEKVHREQRLVLPCILVALISDDAAVEAVLENVSNGVPGELPAFARD